MLMVPAGARLDAVKRSDVATTLAARASIIAMRGLVCPSPSCIILLRFVVVIHDQLASTSEINLQTKLNNP